jgi:hypothetical protein
MSTSEVSNENVIMASFDDMSEEVRNAFEECNKAQEEKEMQELLTCYTNDHRSSVTQIKQPILPSIDSMKEVHTVKVLNSSTPITPKDMSAMFSEHTKFTRKMVGDKVAKVLAKIPQNSKYQPATAATTHSTMPSSSATRSTSVMQPLYGMLLNYFGGQTPLAHNTSMTHYTPELVPISSIPPTLAIPGQARVVPPFAPMSACSSKDTRVRYVAPHTPHPPPPII